MGLRDSSQHVPARVMSAAAATASSPRDNGTNSSAGPESAVNGSATDGQDSRGSADVEASPGGGGGGAARVRRKRRHTCPDYRSSPPPLENGWHDPGKRLSPPPRLGSLDSVASRTPAPGSRRSSEGDGWPGRAARHHSVHERPAKMPRLEICLRKIPGEVVVKKAEGEKMKNGNGADDEPPPPLDGADEVKEEPPDIVKASPPASPQASAPSSPPPASPSSPPPVSPAPSPPASPPASPAPSPPASPPPASPQASPPPTPTSSRKRTNLTETEKLYLNSECHKTEILSTKLRHTACRKSGAATAAKASTKGKSKTTTAQPPVLMPNGGGGEKSGKWRKKGAPTPPRRRRPPPPPKVESPATDSESDGPPHLEPEAPLAAAVAPRAGRGQRRGTPAPQLREAESEADSVSFSFQAAPETEEWFRTFYRQEEGRRAVEDFSWAPAGGGQRLPYQMSEEELFPRDLVPGGGRPRPLRPPTLPDRWLPPLPAAAGEEEKAATAPPEEWLCLEDLCAVLHRASSGRGRSPPGEVEPLGEEVAAALTAWPANCSLRELAVALSERSELSAELPGSEQPSPSGAGGGADVSGCGSPADWSGVDTGSEPSRPPSSADDASSVSTDASAGSGARRKPAKRRKNRTGWPRAKVRKSNLLKAAVSRAAAEARDAAGPS